MERIFPQNVTVLTHDTCRPMCSAREVTQKEETGDRERHNIRVLGLLFAALWSAPCRGFTTRLAEAHRIVSAAGNHFQVILVSADADKDQFEEHFACHSWPAVSFEQQAERSMLQRRFQSKFAGLPCLVLFDMDSGRVIHRNAVEDITSDRDATNFPWRQQAFGETLGDVLVRGRFILCDNANGAEQGLRAGGNKDPETDAQSSQSNFPSSDSAGREVKRKDALEGKAVVLLFSARWCGPCEILLPKLRRLYQRIQARVRAMSESNARDGQEDAEDAAEELSGLEVVFVSKDRDEAEFQAHLQAMPWLAVPFANASGRDALSSRYGVRGLPAVVLVDENGRLAAHDLRPVVESDVDGQRFPWGLRLVEEVEECEGRLEHSAALVVLCEGAGSAGKAAVRRAMAREARRERRRAREAEEEEALSFVVSSGREFGARLREQAGLGDEREPAMIVLDIPDHGGFYLFEGGAIGPASIAAFADDFRQGRLARLQLQ